MQVICENVHYRLKDNDEKKEKAHRGVFQKRRYRKVASKVA